MKASLILLIFVLFAITAQPQQEAPIQVFVDKDMSVSVTIPDFSKQQLKEMVSLFFSRGDEKAKAEFEKQFDKARNITLIVTTKPHGGLR